MGDNIAFFCHVQVCLHEFQFIFILICYFSVVNKNKRIFKPRHIIPGAIQIQRANPLQGTHVTVSHTADASEGSVWRECPPIKFFLFLVLKIISEYANIVVVEAAQVINTDVDIINFAALEESAN